MSPTTRKPPQEESIAAISDDLASCSFFGAQPFLRYEMESNIGIHADKSSKDCRPLLNITIEIGLA